MKLQNPILTSGLLGAMIGGGVGAFTLKKSRPEDVLWMAGIVGAVGLVYGAIRERRGDFKVSGDDVVGTMTYWSSATVPPTWPSTTPFLVGPVWPPPPMPPWMW